MRNEQAVFAGIGISLAYLTISTISGVLWSYVDPDKMTLDERIADLTGLPNADINV